MNAYSYKFNIPKNAMRAKNQKGFSLVTVLSIGLIGTLWVTAAYMLLLPALQEVAKGKKTLAKRVLAETAIDFITNDISKKYNSSGSVYDDKEIGFPFNNFELTPSQLGIETGSNKDMKLLVMVKNVIPPQKPESIFYDIQSIPNIEIKKQWSLMKDGWRIIEIRLKSSNDRTVYRAVLKPIFQLTPATNSGTTFFSDGVTALGTSNMSILKNSEISGNLVTNGSTTTETPNPFSMSGPNITLTGNVSVNSLKLQSDDNVARGETIDDSALRAKIIGSLTTNGNTSGFPQDGDPPTGNQVKISPPSGQGLISKQSNPQASIAPAPSAPSSAIDLGALALSNTSQIVITNGTFDASSFSDSGVTILKVPPGNYKISSLSMLDSSKISVAQDVTTPTSFFIENSSLGSSAFSMSATSSIIGNTSKGANIQFWYNGNRNIQLSGITTASVYAPNSQIAISTANFTGSLVGKNISVTDSKVKLPTDQSLNSNSPRYSLSADGSIKPLAFRRAVMQELTYSDWISQGNAPF